ncbi:MAG TPA: glycosyltransferase family 4 protein [Xanthobacteraceae bacterium]|nr:glycosyltransferase family 4 protein [Xanthobacteraceae bacterium]
MSRIEVVAPNFNRRFSGVTATVVALLPHQAQRIGIRALGPGLPASVPQLRWRDILLGGWRRPTGRPARIWHARRNVEMIAGVMLRYVLCQPWRLVFTSAAQRHHSWITRALIARMDAVIATSPQAASYLKRPATVVLHGVDTARYRPAPDRAAAWAATGLPGRYGIGVFGRVRHQKGQDLFVAAMAELLPRHPAWTAVVIGLSKPEDAAFLEALKARIAAAGLSERVVLLGERPIEEVPLWLRRLSVVVTPARWEGFGLVPLEAMASATPVAATRVGAAADLVREGETGLLLPPDDGPALTRAIDALMTMDEASREAMGRAGRALVEAEFSIDREVEKIGAVYEAVWRG